MTNPTRPQSEHWAQYEPVAAAVDAEAHRLVSVAGSRELAKQAVDSAAEVDRTPQPVRSLDELARHTGFAGRRDLLAASKALNSPNGNLWWATAVPGNRWIVWRLEDISLERTFGSLEEIHEHLARQA